MMRLIECLILIRLIQYNTYNIKEVKQVTTISEEESDKKNETPVIIATLDYEPMSSASKESIMGDIVKEAFKIMDKNYRIIYCQWASCVYKLDQCEIWGLMPSTYTEERAKKYLFSDPIIDSEYKFFYYNKENNKKYNTLEDLRHYIIGIIPGFFYQQKIENNFPFIKYMSNTEFLLKGLINRTIQIALIDEPIGWYSINKYFPDEIENFGTLDEPYTKEEEGGQHIMVCKDYPNAEKIIDEFNDALKILKDTGFVQEIIEKYGAEKYIKVSK